MLVNNRALPYINKIPQNIAPHLSLIDVPNLLGEKLTLFVHKEIYPFNSFKK